ncbi:MAG: hypothetical protein HON90_16195 [Halobacteriovoraceae bacterium]|jgi:hypothetical protein|nr:hypothetical protein [Halobacteriovoraceae bacterium]
MKTHKKKLVLALFIAGLAQSSYAEFANREMANRYRDRHRDMDICLEIKEDLIVARDAYDAFEDKTRSINIAISAQAKQVRSRTVNLNAKQKVLAAAESRHAVLVNKKQNRRQLIAAYRKSRDEATAAIPAAVARKKSKCKGINKYRSRCTRAKDALKHQKKKKQQAQNSINELNNIDQLTQTSSRTLRAAKKALRHEQDLTPTIAQLQQNLTRLQEQKNQSNHGYQEAEARYGRLEVRTEKCEKMKYEAKKASTFKPSLIAFAAEGGCDMAMSRLNSARGKARRDGINEAYELVCNSDILVQEVEVEIEVPGQCSNQQSRTEYIKLDNVFTVGSPTYRANMNVKEVFFQAGAKAIKLDIAKIDIEANFDFLSITDANGDYVLKEHSNTLNNKEETPFLNYSTGWVDGDTLTVSFTSDRLKQLSGFEIRGYEVRY